MAFCSARRTDWRAAGAQETQDSPPRPAKPWKITIASAFSQNKYCSACFPPLTTHFFLSLLPPPWRQAVLAVLTVISTTWQGTSIACGISLPCCPYLLSEQRSPFLLSCANEIRSRYKCLDLLWGHPWEPTERQILTTSRQNKPGGQEKEVRGFTEKGPEILMFHSWGCACQPQRKRSGTQSLSWWQARTGHQRLHPEEKKTFQKLC